MMKKVLLILTIIAFVSCSDDDSSSNECNCMGQWGQMNEVEYTVETQIDCETGEATANPVGPDHVFMGCVEE